MHARSGWGEICPPPKKTPLFPPSLNNVTRYTLETVPFNFLHATGTQQL